MSITTPGGVPTGSIYTDNRGLQQLKTQSEHDPKAALRQAAQQFEAIFVQMMMSSMRQAKLAEGAMDSDATRFYQDLYDKQMGLALSGGNDEESPSRLGIADMLVRQLGGAEKGGGDPIAAQAPVASAGNEQDGLNNGATPQAVVDVGGDRKAERSTPGLAGGAAALLAGISSNNEDSPLEHAHAVAMLKRYAPEFGVGAGTLPAAASASVSELYAGARADGTATSGTAPANGAAAAAATSARQSSMPDRFDSPEQFVASLWDAAAGAADDLGVEPQVLLAQAALETGWGKHLPRHADGSTSHNLFGIKATRSWGGERVQQMTSEFQNGRFERQMDGFRAYDSFADSFKDYVNLLQNSSRYRQAVASSDNPQQFFKELQRAGYATDPNYATKLGKLLSSDTMRDAVAGRTLAAATPVATNRAAG